MSKPSHRDRLLEVGLGVVHAQGWAGASVRDIVQAAGVPQGSFTNHFASKEAFALEVIDIYFARSRENIARTLRNDALPPLQRLRAFMDASRERVSANQMRNGCLLGNFTAEASWSSEPIRLRLLEIFAEVQAALAHCLRAAVKAGEVAPSLDCDEIAAFIVASMQGANLMCKAQRSTGPLERFKEVLFSTILRRIGTADIAA